MTQTPDTLSVYGGTMSLCAILYHFQLMVSCKRHQTVHVGRPAANMDRNDRAAFFGEHCGNCLRGDIAAFSINIGKNGRCPGVDYTGSRRNKCARSNDDLVTSVSLLAPEGDDGEE